MKIHSKLYIGGEWVDPLNPSIFEVVNPLTETVCATVAGGGEDDVARAVAAARARRAMRRCPSASAGETG